MLSNASSLLAEHCNPAQAKGSIGVPELPSIACTHFPAGCAQDFTLNAARVELVMEAENQHFRILGNRNLTVRGPLVLDAEPFGWTQGDLLEANQEEQTLTIRIWDGYQIPTEAERVEFFTPDGVMLPHGQDAVQVRALSAPQPQPRPKRVSRAASCVLAACSAPRMQLSAAQHTLC